MCSDLLASDLSRVARHAGENNPHSTSQTDLVVVWPHFTSTTQPCWHLMMNCRSTPSCISRGIVACPFTTTWQNYPILCSLCLLARVDPQAILVIRTCSTVLHLGRCSFEFDTVSFFSLACWVPTLDLRSATPRPIDCAMSRSTSRTLPCRSEDAWNDQKMLACHIAGCGVYCSVCVWALECLCLSVRSTS